MALNVDLDETFGNANNYKEIEKKLRVYGTKPCVRRDKIGWLIGQGFYTGTYNYSAFQNEENLYISLDVVCVFSRKYAQTLSEILSS
jgi:hypothetical protein